jgi:hypothetical protein
VVVHVTFVVAAAGRSACCSAHVRLVCVAEKDEAAEVDLRSVNLVFNSASQIENHGVVVYFY